MFYSDYNFFSIFLSVLELTETKLENLLKIYIKDISDWKKTWNVCEEFHFRIINLLGYLFSIADSKISNFTN